MAELLTSAEMKTLKSMSRYWDEVNRRDDKSPLGHEIQQVYQILGVRLLFIVSDYVNVRPDLYAACKELLGFVESYGDERHLRDSPENCAHCTLIKKAKAVLAKADGKEK